VALFAPNSVEWIVARLALVALGALAVHCDPEWRGEQLAHAVRLSACRRVFTTKELASRLPSGMEILDLENLPTGERLSHFAATAPDDEASLFFTSGTTGPPKPVPLSHRNILSNVDAVLDSGMLRPDDRLLLPLPLYHAYPFIIGLLTPLASGLPVILPQGVSGPELAHALKDGNVTVLVGVPRLYRALHDGIVARAKGVPFFSTLLALSIFVRRQFGMRIGRFLFGALHRRFAPRLRLLASGGAKLGADLTWKLEGLGWEALNGYGLVETASMAVFERSGHARPGTAGQAGPDTKLRIWPVDGWEKGTGEVQIAGPLVFKGYRDDEAANRAAFTEDGWFRTGDVGFIDPDGFLHIVGRVKEMIVTQGGKKISPEDLEAAYAKSPYIREFAVLEDGDDLVGLVVPELAAVREYGGGRIEDMIRVALAERAQDLPSHERITRFAIAREALPRTQLGKYRRFALPEIFKRAERAEPPPARELTDEDQRLLQQESARAVFDFLVARFPDRTISPDTSPQLDLGIDSLAWVGLGLELEDKLGVKLTEDAIARSVTVRDLLREAVAGTIDAPSPDAERRRRLMADPRWRATRGPVLTAIGMVLYAVALPLIRLYFTLRWEGAENVPTSGPLLIAPNHVSDVDPFVIGAALSLSHMRNFAWSADVQQVFFRPTARLIARPLRMFPVDDRTPAASLAVAEQMLARGHILVWFPESWRSPDGRLQNFQPGIGKLVAESGAPIVPCWIEGAIRSMSRTGHFPRPARIRVRFGKAVTNLKGSPEQIARKLHDAVDALSKETTPNDARKPG
jgi:long-chain acyl-CoA synthetase